jgi:hypothetical protein
LGGTGEPTAILGAVERVVTIVREQASEMLDHLWLYADSSN